jgi:predicted aspartyl protease
MEGIVTPVKIENLLDPSKKIEADALVDTGAYMMTLTNAWRDRLGKLPSSRKVELHLATEETLEGEVCGPVYIQIPGFPRIAGEVLFIEMKPADGEYEPLIGYITLEQSQAAVDMIGHRLTHVRYMDMK